MLFVFACTSVICRAQKSDTLATVKIFAGTGLHPALTPAPVQVLTQEDLNRRSSLSVADAVKYFAGINVKDYGGIGGLKTISVRSLGANQTGVLYDGLVLGDAQGGQTDLGKFSLDNIQQVTLYNGSPTDILLPARAFASAAILSLSSGSVSSKNIDPEIFIAVKGGSFGYWSPSFRMRSVLSKKISGTLSGTYQQASGHYPFRSYVDQNTFEKRTNTALKTGRLEFDVSWFISDSNRVLLKAYYYNSRRNLPGSVIFYNNINDEKLEDQNVFLQGNWRNKISRRNTLLISAKFAKDHTFYLDPSYLSSFGRLENNFHQQEIYISGASRHEISKSLSASFSADFFNSQLKRTDFLAADFARPNRNSFLSNIAIRFDSKKFEAAGNLLFTVINEKVRSGFAGRDLHKFTPAASIAWLPFKNFPLRFRGFYKKIFRAPTFNDLYYTNIGNVNLRPEYADQYDAGITFTRSNILFFQTVTVTGDAYFNKIKDRILAVPRQDAFQWSVQNVAAVNIKGADIALHLKVMPWKEIFISADVSYSYQQALNRSDKNSALYNSQLPYTPEHSGSLSISIEYNKVVFSANTLASSDRYRAGEPGPDNIVAGWNTEDISISYRFTKNKKAFYRIFAEANNLLDRQYEIIKYYPMPRFNYRAGISVSFKKQNTNNEKIFE